MNIRALIDDYLRRHPDGATVSELVSTFSAHDRSVRQALDRMPHVYIDRWKAAKAGPHRYQWAPVYCLFPAPPDAEKPYRIATHEDYLLELK